MKGSYHDEEDEDEFEDRPRPRKPRPKPAKRKPAKQIDLKAEPAAKPNLRVVVNNDNAGSAPASTGQAVAKRKPQPLPQPLNDRLRDVDEIRLLCPDLDNIRSAARHCLAHPEMFNSVEQEFLKKMSVTLITTVKQRAWLISLLEYCDAWSG